MPGLEELRVFGVRVEDESSEGVLRLDFPDQFDECSQPFERVDGNGLRAGVDGDGVESPTAIAR